MTVNGVVNVSVRYVTVRNCGVCEAERSFRLSNQAVCICLNPDFPEPGVPYSYAPTLRAACPVHGSRCQVNPCDQAATVKAWGFDLCREHYAAILAQGGEVLESSM